MPDDVLRHCFVLSSGMYQCKWKGATDHSDPLNASSIAEKIWWWVFLLIVLFATTWFFCWSVFSNDYDDFNWFIYEALNMWFGWGVLILSVLCVIMFYLLLLFFSGITLIGSNKPRRLHLCHKISLVLVLVLCIVAYILVSMLWNEEFYAAVIALNMLGQWFHICLLFVITLSSWLFFYEIMRIENKKAWVFANFCVVIVFLFICFVPLLLHSPCVGNELHQLKKPRVIAHRLGVTKYAPENTILSYEEASNVCGDFDVETDISISYDGVPFLFHDTKDMKRTTNVENVFPDLADQVPELFTWEQLQKLDAGSWFLEQNPYHTVNSMSEEYKAKIKQQNIPSLFEFAKLLVETNRNQSILFDLFTPVSDHPYITNFTEIVLETLLTAGLRQDQILWLPSTNRSKIHILAPDVTMVGTASSINSLQLFNINTVNVGYYETTADSISNYINNNISVIQYRIETPWLFSYAWCQGTSYVTSNSCNLLKDLSQPVWTFTTGGYAALWVCMDILFFIILISIFLIQYYRSECMFLPLFRQRGSQQNLTQFESSALELCNT